MEDENNAVQPEGLVATPEAFQMSEETTSTTNDAEQSTPVPLSSPPVTDDTWKMKIADSLDPQVLFGDSYQAILERRKSYLPCDVDVLEISQFGTGDSISSINKKSCMNEEQLLSWLKANELPSNEEGKKASGGLRLIMGASNPKLTLKDLPAEFPHHMGDARNYQHLPFGRGQFRAIIEKLHLPLATEWVFATDQSHFQRHSTYDRESPYIGYTMRRPTRGILSMNICLSISHDCSTGITNALLLGCSDKQQVFLLEQLKILAKLANHPLLLPTLLSVHQQRLLNREKDRLFGCLIQVETETGQTGAPAVGGRPSPEDSKDYDQITRDVLGVIQLSLSWVSRTKELQLGIEAIEESMRHLEKVTEKPRRAVMEDTENVLSGWLRYTTHRSSTMLCDLQYIEQRAQAQMTAVYNYIAQRDAQLSQKLSEYSTELAADSREISAASKRDSTAMKGIAVLTMVFLPGTFLATFFAMPIFDFSTTPGPRVHEPGFWIYWTVTIPLTIFVLGAYIVYLLIIQRKNRREDKEARENINDQTSSIFSDDKTESQSPIPQISRLLNLFSKVRQDSEPSLELGRTSHSNQPQRKKSTNFRRKEKSAIEDDDRPYVLPKWPPETMLPLHRSISANSSIRFPMEQMGISGIDHHSEAGSVSDDFVVNRIDNYRRRRMGEQGAGRG